MPSCVSSFVFILGSSSTTASDRYAPFSTRHGCLHPDNHNEMMINTVDNVEYNRIHGSNELDRVVRNTICILIHQYAILPSLARAPALYRYLQGLHTDHCTCPLSCSMSCNARTIRYAKSQEQQHCHCQWSQMCQPSRELSNLFVCVE